MNKDHEVDGDPHVDDGHHGEVGAAEESEPAAEAEAAEEAPVAEEAYDDELYGDGITNAPDNDEPGTEDDELYGDGIVPSPDAEAAEAFNLPGGRVYLCKKTNHLVFVEQIYAYNLDGDPLCPTHPSFVLVLVSVRAKKGK